MPKASASLTHKVYIRFLKYIFANFRLLPSSLATITSFPNIGVYPRADPPLLMDSELKYFIPNNTITMIVLFTIYP